MVNASLGFAALGPTRRGAGRHREALGADKGPYEPGVYRTKDGTAAVVCGRQHLEDFRRFKELAEAIENDR